LAPQIENYLQKARAGLKSTPQATINQRPALGKTLAQFRQDADPLQDDCLINDNYGAAVHEAQSNLREALASGDKARIRAALDNLRYALQNYNNSFGQATAKKADPGKRENLNNQARAIGDIYTDLIQLPEETENEIVQRTLAPLDSYIDDFSDSLHADRSDDFVKGLAISSNVASSVSGPSDQELDMSGLLKRAGDLSDLLRGMVGTVNPEENGFDRFGQDSYGAISDVGKSAVDLKNATKTLGGEGDYFGQDASLINESFFSPRGNESFFSPRSNTVSDVMQAVANNITSKSKFLKSEAADNLAKDLAALSAAARTGKKK